MAPRRRDDLPCLYMVLLFMTGALTACGTDGYLGSTEPATIEAYEFENEVKIYPPREPPSTAEKVADWVPGVGTLVAIARFADWATKEKVVVRTVYTVAIHISRIDGEAVALGTKKIEVPHGDHTIEVKYCRYAEPNSSCSKNVEISFRAEPGVSYRLRRNSELQIELKPNSTDKKTFVSEARAVVAQDGDDCIRDRKLDIEFRARTYPKSKAEMARLLSAVQPYCRALVRGAPWAAE